jgi:hypothetical protein
MPNVFTGTEDTAFLLPNIVITTLDPLTFGAVQVTVNLTTRFGSLTWTNNANGGVSQKSVAQPRDRFGR